MICTKHSFPNEQYFPQTSEAKKTISDS